MIDASATTILVVDDDEIFRRRIARAFRDRDYTVVEGGTIREAIDQTQVSSVDYALVDLKIGNESGLDLLQQLRKLNDAMKVVVLTGYGTIATAVDAVKLGAVNYLSKPVDADTALAAFQAHAPTQNAPVATPHLEQVEWEHIQRVIRDFDGNISKASKALGLHRRSLQRKLAKNPTKLR